MKTSVLQTKFSNPARSRTQASTMMLMTAAMLLLSMVTVAQTYTTRADGNWNSTATWVGGIVPPATISAGRIVNVKHDVTVNLTVDVTIAGQLNVEGDTLRFPATFDKKILVTSGGLLRVKNGGLLTYMQGRRNDLAVDGGKVYFENATVLISKGFSSSAGGNRTIVNTNVTLGETYSLQGTSTSLMSIDTLWKSKVETGFGAQGGVNILAFGSLRVGNATIITGASSDLVTQANSDISMLPYASGNYGFTRLKTGKDLDVSGAWDARIDAHCVEGTIKGATMGGIDFTRSEDCSDPNTATVTPELVFRNPVLRQGQANKEGAVYRFPNVTPGIDAEIRLKKFSRNDIVMQSIDLASMGWDKAFQPQFGLPGLVQPFQNWYIDFEMTFYNAGTNQRRRVAKFDLTALDVDGDGNSVSEYAMFENPTNIIYSTVSYLTNQSAGLNGQTFACDQDAISSTLVSCTACGGDGKGGLWNIDPCANCSQVGLVHSACGHAFEGVNGSTLAGPVENFVNIDTLATQVMATYQYVDRDQIRFRYGAKSGSRSSNGSGIRLNSLWFRSFSMAPPTTLPIRLNSFSATLNRKNVTLNWDAQEENFSHYILQRSEDGNNFVNIATLFASNASTSSYSYNDLNVVSRSGVLFYRLQLVDNTKETAKTSDIRVIRLAKEAAGLQLSTYPNPVIEQVKITLPGAWQGKQVMLEVLSANGTRVQSLQLGSASQTETLQLTSLTKGFYIIKAVCNGEVAEQRIVKN